MKKRFVSLCAAVLLVLVSFAVAEEKVDLSAIYKIKDEGLNRSQIMEIMSYLTDVYSPRLAGSSGLRKGADWVQGKFREWGLQNVHVETYDFGRSWELRKFQAHMVEPVYSPLIPPTLRPGFRARKASFYIVGFMTFAGGLALAVKSHRFRGEDPQVQWPAKDGWVRIGVNLLLLALYTALMDPLGMPIATGLYVAGAIWYMDRTRVLAAPLAGAGSAVVVYHLFIRLLGLSFPLGPLAR